jgi:hypothetical protein
MFTHSHSSGLALLHSGRRLVLCVGLALTVTPALAQDVDARADRHREPIVFTVDVAEDLTEETHNASVGPSPL